MLKHRRRPPSLGFWILVASHVVMIAFLAWGFSEPPLDRVQRVLDQIRANPNQPASDHQVQAVLATLRRHPGFARALVGHAQAGFLEPDKNGWLRLAQAHLVTQPQNSSGLRVWIEVDGPAARFPVELSLSGGSVQKTLRYQARGRLSFDLTGADAARPLMLRVQSVSQSTCGNCLPVRIRASASSTTDSEGRT